MIPRAIRFRQGWHTVKAKQRPQAEEFLKGRELYCVNACAKFLLLPSAAGEAWFLGDRAGNMSAFLLRWGGTLFPVFSREADIPAPPFMGRLGTTLPWRRFPVYAVQGRREDVEILERIMEERGYTTRERFDYDLMSMTGPPSAAAMGAGPAALRLRRPEAGDMDALYLLQAAYEQEEVLPRGTAFDPAYCRLAVERMAAREQVLTAELDGRLVGKINTNARAFSRCQIGGVYVLPDYRNRGIALSMTAAFVGFLSGWPLTLFVKKHNSAARAVYRKTGFSFAGDYRISYYESP